METYRGDLSPSFECSSQSATSKSCEDEMVEELRHKLDVSHFLHSGGAPALNYTIDTTVSGVLIVSSKATVRGFLWCAGHSIPQSLQIVLATRTPAA